MIPSVKYLNKMENLPKRAIKFMISDYESSYDELLRLPGSCAINVRLKINLCVEKGAVREGYKINLEIPRVNQASFGTKSLRFYGPKTSPPYHIRSAENYYVLKISSKVVMVHFVVVKPTGSSTL